MILTGDEIVKCPKHGVRPWATAKVHSHNPMGERCFPFWKLTCIDCGREVRQMCRGDTAQCKVIKRALTRPWCNWHQCQVER